LFHLFVGINDGRANETYVLGPRVFQNSSQWSWE